MDRDTPPHQNTFAGLSLVLNRAAERRDDGEWIAAQASAPDVRYVLLDAAGEAFMHRDREALRCLDQREYESLGLGLPASFLGLIDTTPHFCWCWTKPRRSTASKPHSTPGA